MSWNNIMPAVAVLDLLKQEELTRDEYLAWLKEEADAGCYWSARRLEVENEQEAI